MIPLNLLIKIIVRPVLFGFKGLKVGRFRILEIIVREDMSSPMASSTPSIIYSVFNNINIKFMSYALKIPEHYVFQAKYAIKFSHLK